MKAQDFVESCQDIWGEGYVTLAAKALGISVRSVQYYAKGQRPVPYWMPARLQKAATPLLERMQARMAMLEGFRRAAGVDATLAHPRHVKEPPDARAKQAAREAALRVVHQGAHTAAAPDMEDDGPFEEREEESGLAGLDSFTPDDVSDEDDTDWGDDDDDEGDV